MSKPCKECPFSKAFEGRYSSENLILFVGAVCEDEGQICHLTEDRDCVGAQMFFEGGHPEVHEGYAELALARARDPLAAEFFSQMIRLMETK